VTHGTRSGYNSGCRCTDCTEANTAASRARRQGLAGRTTTSSRAELQTRRPALQAPRRISPRRPSFSERATAIPAAPRPLGLWWTWPRRSLVPRAGEGAQPTPQEVEADNWDEYAKRLRYYLAGQEPSPTIQQMRRSIRARGLR